MANLNNPEELILTLFSGLYPDFTSTEKVRRFTRLDRTTFMNAVQNLYRDKKIEYRLSEEGIEEYRLIKS